MFCPRGGIPILSTGRNPNIALVLCIPVLDLKSREREPIYRNTFYDWLYVSSGHRSFVDILRMKHGQDTAQGLYVFTYSNPRQRVPQVSGEPVCVWCTCLHPITLVASLFIGHLSWVPEYLLPYNLYPEPPLTHSEIMCRFYSCRLSLPVTVSH